MSLSIMPLLTLISHHGAISDNCVLKVDRAEYTARRLYAQPLSGNLLRAQALLRGCHT